MSRTTRGVLRTELLRGTAPAAAAVFAVAGPVMLFNETEYWVGRWGPLAEYIRVMLLVLGPVAVAAGAWQAGRERRRRIAEQLTATPRPHWQPVLVGWATVTLGLWAGLLLTWLSGAVLVAPIATYGGRSWWLTLGVGFVALAAACALGIVAGRHVGGWFAAPAAGVVSYVGLGVVTYAGTSHGWPWLSPTLGNARQGVQYLAADFQLLQAFWLAAVAATLLVAMSAGRTWLAAAPAAVAVAAAVPIVTGPGYDRWQADPDATEQVCAGGRGPEVCLATVNAFLLDDVTPPVREALAQWDGVPDGFDRAVDASSRLGSRSESAPDGTVVLDFVFLISWTGGLSGTDEYGYSIEQEVADATTQRPWQECSFEVRHGELQRTVENAANAWAGGSRPSPLTDKLLALPAADQQDWMGRYLTAARACDGDALAELAEELR